MFFIYPLSSLHLPVFLSVQCSLLLSSLISPFSPPSSIPILFCISFPRLLFYPRRLYEKMDISQRVAIMSSFILLSIYLTVCSYYPVILSCMYFFNCKNYALFTRWPSLACSWQRNVVDRIMLPSGGPSHVHVVNCMGPKLTVCRLSTSLIHPLIDHLHVSLKP